MKEIIVCGKPEFSKEEFVRHVFSKHAEELGFKPLLIQKAFPDCHAIDLRNNRNKEVYIEFEYIANNFLTHKHDKQIQKHKEYIVMCWLPTGKDKIPKDIEVIPLSNDKRIKVISPEEEKRNLTTNDVLFRALAFNSNFVYGKSIEIFNQVSLFVTNNVFKNDYLPKDSIIVLFEKGYFIGEFKVASYHKLERKPKTDYEKQLFNILSYPVTFADDIIKENKFYKSYIGFKEFKIYNPSIPCSVINKNLSHGVTSLTIEELYTIRGKG